MVCAIFLFTVRIRLGDSDHRHLSAQLLTMYATPKIAVVPKRVGRLPLPLTFPYLSFFFGSLYASVICGVFVGEDYLPPLPSSSPSSEGSINTYSPERETRSGNDRKSKGSLSLLFSYPHSIIWFSQKNGAGDLRIPVLWEICFIPYDNTCTNQGIYQVDRG